MRLPWVSRAQYDLLQHNYERLYQLRHEDARFDALLDKYHSLRLQGANPVEAPKPQQPKEPDAVQYAISNRAGSNVGLRFHLSKWAAEQRFQKVEDGEIIDRINNWHSESDD